jgi:hypothetical protein
MAAKKTASRSRADVTDILERVVRAEERVVLMDERHAQWHNETKAAHDAVASRLTAIEHSLQKYQGAWGAVTLVLTAVGVALTFFKDFIARKLGFGA